MENAGRVAIQRGPLLYCAEATDNPDCDLRDLAITPAPLEANFEADLLGGVVVLEGQGTVIASLMAWNHRLYAPAATLQETGAKASHPVPLKLIPYYAWANRAAGRMQVWLKTWAE